MKLIDEKIVDTILGKMADDYNFLCTIIDTYIESKCNEEEQQLLDDNFRKNLIERVKVKLKR